MKHIKTFTALSAAIFLAASLTVCGISYPAGAQTLNTPSIASPAAASGAIGKSLVPSSDPEEDPLLAEYAGEYIMFGLGDTYTNFQNKKVVVDSSYIDNGSVILNSDGTGLLIGGEDRVPVSKWSVNDGNISISYDSYEFTGTINDGVIMLTSAPYSESYYFALEGTDLSSWSIVDDDDYEMMCIAGTYYLTNETLDDGSTFLNRTQISWNVLSGLGDASLKLYEDGTGALDVGDHRDIEWDAESIILDDEEYYFDFGEGVIILDMYDYTMEFTCLDEEDIYLQLTLDEVTDSVTEIPGNFYPLGDSGLKYYVPNAYVMRELTEEDIADDLVSNFVEETDINDNDYYDNDIYAYQYPVYEENDLPALEETLEYMGTRDGVVDCFPIIINGIEFGCSETVHEDTDEHIFLFRTVHSNGYVTDIKYRTEESIMSDEFRSLAFKLASAICINT